MGPTHHVNVAVSPDGTARVLWLTGKRGMCERKFGSQEEAEHFAAGVQAGLISAGLSATVEIVTVGETTGCGGTLAYETMGGAFRVHREGRYRFRCGKCGAEGDNDGTPTAHA